MASEDNKGTLSGSTVLVCGGAGFIGSNFIHYALEKYPDIQIVNYDKLTYAGNLDNLRDVEKDKQYEFIKGDIADLKHVLEVFEKYKPDYIINFAAETHVDRSVHENAAPFMWTNILGVQTLLEAVKKKGIKKGVFFSTDEVFGSVELEEERSFKEDDPFAPNVPYAAAKAGGDLLCRAYHVSFDLPIIVTHCCNNYGPYQYPEKLIPFFVFRALKGEPLPLYGDGKHVRDWIHVEDTCRAVDHIFDKGSAGGAYNIGTGCERSNMEVTKLILDHAGASEDLIKFVDERPGHDRRYSLDTTRIKKEVGWEPKYNFEQGLPKTIKWYKKNRDWVQSVVKKAKEFNRHIDL